MSRTVREVMTVWRWEDGWQFSTAHGYWYVSWTWPLVIFQRRGNPS